MSSLRRKNSFAAKNHEVKGWMRKTVQQIKVFQHTSFPLRFFVCDKVRKRLCIYDQPEGQLKEEVEIGRLVKVDVVDAQYALEEQKQNGNKDGPTIVVPTDYPFPFTLYLTNRTMLLWANDEEERKHWVDCLRTMISEFEQQQLTAGNQINLSHIKSEQDMSYAR